MDIDCKAVATAFATVSALFRGVTKISQENKLYGDDVEDESVIGVHPIATQSSIA